MDPRRLVFVDETGAATNTARRHGRRPRGERLGGPVPHGHRKSATLLAGLTVNGPTAPHVFDGAADGRLFRARTERMPAPAADDVVIVDDLPAHKVAGAREAIGARGAKLLYLPPYSPDPDPTGQAFAKLKAVLRKAAERSVAGLRSTIGGLLGRFPPAECADYLADSGYPRSA